MTSNNLEPNFFDAQLETARELIAVARRQPPQDAAQTYLMAEDAVNAAAAALRGCALSASTAARAARVEAKRAKIIAKNRIRRETRLSVKAVFDAPNTVSEVHTP